jgi:hypothetical protein
MWHMSTGLYVYTAWNRKIWSWIQRGPEPKVTALAKPAATYPRDRKIVYKEFREQRMSALILQTSIPTNFVSTSYLQNKTNCVGLVGKQTIPTERSPLVGEVSANFCG